MANFSWVKMFFPRYWTKTRHFATGAQHGIYLNLLGANMFNGPLPKDEAQLFKISQSSVEEWAAHGANILTEFFKLTKAGYVNQRAMDVRFDAMKGTADETKKINGKSGGHKKAANTRAKITSGEDMFPLECGEEIEHGWGDDEPPTPYTPSAIDCTAAVTIFNAMADRAGLPKIQKLSDPRKKKLKARLIDAGGLEGWKTACDLIETIPGMRGKNNRGWKASFDFMLQASSFIKLMEGNYNDWNGTRKDRPSDSEDSAAVLRSLGLGHLEDGGPASHKAHAGTSGKRNGNVIPLSYARHKG